MKPRLQDQGWYIAEVDCANGRGYWRIAAQGFYVNSILKFLSMDILMLWGVKDNITDIYGINMRKGLFVFYKNFEDIFSTHPDLYNGYGAEFMLQLIEDIVYYYSKFRGNIYEQYPVVVGYGVGLPSSYIPRFEELMGAENVMIAGEGVRYPWSDFEEEQRRTSRTVPRTLCTIKKGSSMGLRLMIRILPESMWKTLGIILNHHL